MASPEELDELFAYLDQLALNERLEQEKDVVTGVELQGGEAGHGAMGLVELPEEAVVEASGGEPCLLTTSVSDELETTAILSLEAPSTPPRGKIVQFDAVTPMKTPQRKAPKLVFTPLRPVQPIIATSDLLSLDSSETPKEPEEEILEGVVLSPADSSFRRSFIHDSPNAQTVSTTTEPEDIDISDDVSQVSFIISAPASPSHVSVDVDEFEPAQNDPPEESDVPSPIRPAATPRRQTKKRVVYSSDEDAEAPAPRISPPPPRTDEAIDVEIIGESASPKASQLDRSDSSGKKKATRSKSRKATKDVSKFFDTIARATGKDSGDDDSDDAGSLDDFIVDDDYVEYEKEDSDDPDAYVLTYSPTTPKPRKKAAPAVSVTVDLTETSDEEVADPIPSVTTGRPKARPRAPLNRPQPTETPKKSRTEKKSWKENKQKLAMDIMQELDELVFEDKLVKEWNVAPVWNNKLLTTAGRAHHKRMKMSDGTFNHEGRIELSEKVIDDEAKLKNTVAHEMCHLATWIISGEMKNPHGAVFKSWGKKVMRARRDIEVTTKHSYEITYKYEWECVTEGCDAVYRRHSKSIDIETQACGKCRGRLRPLFKTRGAGAGSTPFQDFLKQNMKLAKAAMPKATHGEVMRALSERWKAIGGAKSAAEIVEAGEDPIAAQRADAEYWQVMSLQMQGLSIA